MAAELKDQPKEMTMAEMRAAIAQGDGDGQPVETKVEDPKKELPASQSEGVLPKVDETVADSGTAKQQEQVEGEKPKDGKFKAKEPAEDQDAVQKRINKMTWEKHEVARQLETERRRIAELEARLAEKQTQATGKPEDKTPATASAFTKPEPVEPDAASFDDLPSLLKAQGKYAKDLVAWNNERFQFDMQQRAQAEAAERTAKEVAARQQESAKVANENWNANLERAMKTEPKIPEMLDGGVRELLQETGQSGYVALSKVGPEIVAHIWNHAQEVASVVKTGDPMEMARYVAVVEKELIQSLAPNPLDIKERRELPNPIKVVGGNNPVMGVDLNDPKIPIKNWYKGFRQQMEAERE